MADDDPAQASATGPGHRPRVLALVTGLSGAGKSTALAALEDIGFMVVDNLPLSLLDELVALGERGDRPVALGIDVRARDFESAAIERVVQETLDRPDLDARLVFLDCDDDVLVQRYSKTRRRHPVAGERPVQDGVRLERRLIAPLRRMADPVIDTSDETVHGLRRRLQDQFAGTSERRLSVFVVSFSYGHGVPRQADLVFDVRFLRNPYYVDRLRPMSGLDEPVGAYIADDPDFEPFLDRVTDMLSLLLPRYRSEGKSYLTIAFGCTGGRHRSVYIARRAAQWLKTHDWHHTIDHRDLSWDVNLDLNRRSKRSPRRDELA